VVFKMRKILMFVALVVFLVSPSAFAQKRKAVRHRSSRSVTKTLSPVMVICVDESLPSGYSIVKQTFDSRCSKVDNSAYLISTSGEATEAMAASAPVSTRQHSSDDSESESGSGRSSVLIRIGGSNAKEDTRTPNEKRADDSIKEAKFKIAASQHTVLVGMSAAQVIDAWGQPAEVGYDYTSSSGGRSTMWKFRRGYQNASVYLTDGIVTSWQFTN
jgi:hypothetical protein